MSGVTSPKTLEAYQRDVFQFLAFLTAHLGGAPLARKTLQRFGRRTCAPSLAARRAEGVGSRSLMRTLAGMRGFARYLERNGKGSVGALSAVRRAPKIGKTLPRPLHTASQPSAAWRIPNFMADDDRAPWVHARDAAVLALLYGSGLRISEALSLKHEDLGSGRDAITVTGKGRKQRMVPVLPQVQKLVADYVALYPYDLPQDGPLFVGAKGGPLSARVVQLAMARLRGALGLAETATPHALRHSFATHLLAGRRSARDPGTARACFVGDDADLYGGRCRTPDRGLSQRPSARLTEFRAIRSRAAAWAGEGI